MGEGTTYSYRFDNNRKPTPQEQITYWESKAMQYKSERDQLVGTNERLALRLGQVERTIVTLGIRLEYADRIISVYGKIFGFEIIRFQTPTAPETTDQPQSE